MTGPACPCGTCYELLPLAELVESICPRCRQTAEREEAA